MPPKKLLSCPFCNSSEIVFAIRPVSWRANAGTTNRKVAICNACGAHGPAFGIMSFNNESAASTYWNTRNPSPELVELRKDKERLDWLSSNLQFELVPDFNNSGHFVVRIGRPGYEGLHTPLRTAIDAAMKENK